MIYSLPAGSVDLFLLEAPTGLVGTLTFRLENATTGTVEQANSTAGITEPQPGTYKRTITAPEDEGYYVDVWTNGSTVVRGDELLKVTLRDLPPAIDVPEPDAPIEGIQRVLQGRPARISATFTDIYGAAADPAPDSATVTLVRDDGTVIFSDRAAANGAAGEFTTDLTPSDTADLDWLYAQWTAHAAGVDQTITTRVEVGGGVLFTLAEARRDEQLSDEAEFPTDAILRERVAAESDIEDACRRAFVPRYRRETCWGVLNGRLALRRDLRRLRWVKVDGTLLTSDQLAAVRTLAPRRLLLPVRGLAQRVDVAYECGDDTSPARGRLAALILARSRLVDGPITDRATATQTDVGTITLATPGVRGSTFGIPEVDAFVNDHEYVDLLPA
jgi:hypothetical protein